MAAHLEGKAVVTQDAGGLAQKGGATWSHVQIAQADDLIFTSKVDQARADLVLGCDAIVAAGKATLALMQAGRSWVLLNSHPTPTANFVHDTQWQFPQAACTQAISQVVGSEGLAVLDAEAVAVAALGDSIYTNPLLLGFAWQRGRVPLSRAALLRAIEINAVQVAKNQEAFEWGCHCAQHLDQVQAASHTRQVINWAKKSTLPEVLSRRIAELTVYQNASYARRYQAQVIAAQELDGLWAQSQFSEAVAHNLFKLMAYKDEYEVARLYSDGVFAAKLASQFDGSPELYFHLAPPLWAKSDAQGHLLKQRLGPWLMTALKLLARFRTVRGSWLDPFGYTKERRAERALLAKYLAQLEHSRALLAQGPQKLSDECYQLACQLARLPHDIRGFGHVKARHLALAMEKWDHLAAQLEVMAAA
jgi:indolepyruvate ferredoxin oxidoreductase